MSLQFITGNSGSGKSTWLYEQVIAEAAEYPQKNFLYLVPEQFTMQTQKEFIDRHPSHSILNIDVLSFERLAYRVFDELGMMDFVVLEETGKNLVLRSAALKKEGSLSVLGAGIRKTGYISEIKSLISELTQYHVSPEDLESVRDGLEQKNALWYKLGDILTLYRGFQDFLEGKYVTSDEIVTLDNYTGFTPVQNEFLEELLVLAERVQAALTTDDREPLYGRANVQELFYLSKKTYQSLCEIAKRQGVEILEPVVMGNGRNRRYQNAPAIFHLEQNLFRRNPAKYRENPAEIQICSLFQPKNELRYVAGEIRRLVSGHGYRFIDIAVVDF